MSLRRRLIKSFHFAFRGLQYAWRHELNFRIETLTALVVVIAGLVLGITREEWMALLLVILSVFVLELFNSVIEILVDLVKPRLHEYVQIVKDVMAGAVLLASLIAAVIGFTIFIPYII